MRVEQRTQQLQSEVRSARAAQEQASPACCGGSSPAQEEQRARIARDLHDQLGQQLTALAPDARARTGRTAAPSGATRTWRRRAALAAGNRRAISISSPGSCGRPRSTTSGWPRRCRGSVSEWSGAPRASPPSSAPSDSRPASCSAAAETDLLPRRPGSAEQRRQARARDPRRRDPREPRRRSRAGDRGRRRRLRSVGRRRWTARGIGLRRHARARGARAARRSQIESTPGQGHHHLPAPVPASAADAHV